MKNNIAISVNDVSKIFTIPHERNNTVKGAFVSVFHKKKYESFRALSDVFFEVEKGEFFGIIGRNGSGKSTLLKILASIYQADKGSIKVNGRISPFLELGIGFNPELSGRDNIYLNGTVLGLTHKEIEEKFDDIVKFSELEKFIDQKLKNYSSGMSVRLAFSVAIHANRDILLMDEVLAVGDSNFQRKCLEVFKHYKKIGKTVLLVTHDINIAQQYCDRIMFMDNGKVESIGKPEEVATLYFKKNMQKEEAKEKANEDIHSYDVDSDKEVSIRKVEFLDSAGNEKKVFQTGEDILLRISYGCTKKIINPVFGIAVFDQQGNQISGPNSLSDGHVIDKIEGDGYVDCKIVSNPFFSGNYLFSVALHDETGTIIYDIREQSFLLKIMSNEKNQRGLIKLNIEWNKPK